mmetsp:Transcript_20307/g.30388  ORF Transcript_20307/g.30388 Transcript_20307/m.30388 type:complete len:322 (+) Transcript_20307:395-1360(+)
MIVYDTIDYYTRSYVMENKTFILDVIDINGVHKENIFVNMKSNINMKTYLIKEINNTIRFNKLQVHKRYKHAGEETSAQSWGTGKGKARLPRYKSGGTINSGQGAVTNMCRGGRVFGTYKTLRRWMWKTNKKLKQNGVKIALIATLLPSIVITKGHVIKDVKYFPLIIENLLELAWSPQEILRILKNTGGFLDLARVNKMKKKSSFSTIKGPLLILDKYKDIITLAQNITGLEISTTANLNFMKLAPGGKLGRLCIYTKTSFLSILNILNERNILQIKNHEISNYLDFKMRNDMTNEIRKPTYQKQIHRSSKSSRSFKRKS